MQRHFSFSKICPISGNTLGEEIVNSATHGLGLLLSIVGATVLVISSWAYGDPYYIIGCSIYGSTLVLLYLASTLYHSSQNLSKKRVFQVFDHICIYLLIAGSYTPLTLGPLKGVWGWSTLLFIWTLALVGIVLKITHKNFSNMFGVGLYLTMGWLSLIIMCPLSINLSTKGIAWLVAGGGFYSFGIVFYLWESLFLGHSIWHLFTIAGSTCHYFCILYHVIPH